MLILFHRKPSRGIWQKEGLHRSGPTETPASRSKLYRTLLASLVANESALRIEIPATPLNEPRDATDCPPFTARMASSRCFRELPAAGIPHTACVTTAEHSHPCPIPEKARTLFAITEYPIYHSPKYMKQRSPLSSRPFDSHAQTPPALHRTHQREIFRFLRQRRQGIGPLAQELKRPAGGNAGRCRF